MATLTKDKSIKYVISQIFFCLSTLAVFRSEVVHVLLSSTCRYYQQKSNAPCFTLDAHVRVWGVDVFRTLLEPLADVQQERVDRKAAYAEVKKEVSKWLPIVQKNRQAEVRTGVHAPLTAHAVMLRPHSPVCTPCYGTASYNVSSCSTFMQRSWVAVGVYLRVRSICLSL